MDWCDDDNGLKSANFRHLKHLIVKKLTSFIRKSKLVSKESNLDVKSTLVLLETGLFTASGLTGSEGWNKRKKNFH